VTSETNPGECRPAAGPDPFLAGGAMPHARAWLRSRPHLQGLVLAPFALGKRLPHQAAGTYVLMYHEVGPRQEGGLRKHLGALRRRGPFITWEEALTGLTGAAVSAGPRFCLTFDDGHKEWAGPLLGVLQELDLRATFFITTNKVASGTSATRLTWGEASRLVEAGHHIGSHSVSHARLALLDNRAAQREVLESKQELEMRLGIAVKDFSMPYGLPNIDYTERDLDLVREAGYRSSASALPGRLTSGMSEFAVPRCGLNPSWPLLAVRKRVHE
jgi:peptidoglycan/xylan/chitin deacetylase (PgdA/CDA1 family)